MNTYETYDAYPPLAYCTVDASGFQLFGPKASHPWSITYEEMAYKTRTKFSLEQQTTLSSHLRTIINNRQCSSSLRE